MAHTVGKLTALKVARAQQPGMYHDGHGLYLQVTERGRSWIYRYMLNGRAREMGLGPLALYGLSEERTVARTPVGFVTRASIRLRPDAPRVRRRGSTRPRR